MIDIKTYEYERGPVFIDGWRLNNSYGDCDDFALTVAHTMAGGWLKLWWKVLTFQCVFWLVKSPSNGIFPRHVVLWYRGRGWIDSTERAWRDTPAPHKLRLPLLMPWPLLMAALGWLYSKVVR